MAAPRTKTGTMGTEYTDNYVWTEEQKRAASRSAETSGLFTGNAQLQPTRMEAQQSGFQHAVLNTLGAAEYTAPPPNVLQSEKYNSIYRDTVVHKDERGHYIDPYKTIATKPYGRRLMYDDTHPEKMYGSQWSSELADMNGCYSFPTTTEFDPELPWTKDMSWQCDGETGYWPTECWKHWTKVAQCPPYEGHSDQTQYMQYKVQVPTD